MIYMLGGLILFFAIHLVPLFKTRRQRLIQQLGRGTYLGIYSLLSAIGLGLMVHGYRSIETVMLWAPVSIGRPLAHALMPVALVLVIAAYLPTHLKLHLRHPMLIGVAIWASVHLLANGDLASTLLFGSFLLYAPVDIAFSPSRETLIPRAQPRRWYDALAVIIGLLAYGALLVSHGDLFGVGVL